MDKDNQMCHLCYGTGDDKTGLATNGWPVLVCVRCGGYGSIPNSCRNSMSVTITELVQMEYEKSKINRAKYEKEN